MNDFIICEFGTHFTTAAQSGPAACVALTFVPAEGDGGVKMAGLGPLPSGSGALSVFYGDVSLVSSLQP